MRVVPKSMPRWLRLLCLGLVVVVLAWALIYVFGLPMRALPYFFYRIPAWRSCSDFMLETFGVGHIEWYGFGKPRSWEVSKGPKMPLVRGNYFAPSGAKVCQVRHGEGLAIRFYTNGYPQIARFYKNGQQEGPCVTWYANGTLKSFGVYSNGESQGRSVGFWEDGETKAAEVFLEKGYPVSDTRWFRSGAVRSRFMIKEDGARVIEMFAEDGSLTNSSVLAPGPLP